MEAEVKMDEITLQPVYIALIAAGSGIIGLTPPVLLQWMLYRNAAQTRQEEWDRQDEVAEQAAKNAELLLERQDTLAHAAETAAKLLLERQNLIAAQAAEAAQLLLERQDETSSKTAEAAELLLAANERVASSSNAINTKLDVIHILVNSQMTASKQSELDATSRSLVMMKEIVALNSAQGRDVTNGPTVEIKATEEKIAELKAEIADRLEQTRIAENLEKTKKLS